MPMTRGERRKRKEVGYVSELEADDEVSIEDEADAVESPKILDEKDVNWMHPLGKSECAKNMITIHIGGSLHQDVLLKERYPADTLQALSQKHQVAQCSPQAAGTSINALDINDGPEGPFVYLPEVLPHGLNELMRWLKHGKINPQSTRAAHPTTWTEYYSPILPEDVAVGVAELGQRLNLPGFYNEAINMLAKITEHELWDEKLTFGQTVEMVTWKLQPDLSFSRMLIMYWVFEHIVTGGKSQWNDMGILGKSEELHKIWWEEHARIMEANPGKNMKTAKDNFIYPDIKCYYW
ncbi:hypothetical protein EJ08DRAFT_662805 [Tothia fuscella]|uniref:Uncharacterized protein n=1 Tax=Tothia fuscella TaxID=1048955 RepID=A0A9P4TW84_9PEZI|nr:hypothetical protein EJ08DRAFT_662805 [Tothia fuscella]